MQWQALQLPLASGLQQKYDARARPVPALEICRDVQFDELGGLQTRFPFAAMNNNILGGGTLANCRRMFVNGDELCVLTSDSLYTWNAQLSRWVLKGTHLAVKLTETPRFTSTDDQVEGDRAELNNAIVFTWCVNSATIYVAALDKATGSVLLAPTAITGTNTRPRLVALSTRILLAFQDNANNLKGYALDPTTPGTAIAGAATTLLATNANLFYDVVRIGSTDVAALGLRRVTTTSYSVLKVAIVAGSISVTGTATPARTCDGPIAVSVDPNAAFVQVIRANGSSIVGDLINLTTLADVFINQAVGTATDASGGLITPVNQIAAAHRSVQNGGQFRCYAFWSAGEIATFTSTGFLTKTNFVDTGNTLGTQSNFMLDLAPGSRAFDFNGSVYLWLTFGRNSAFQGDVALTNQTQAQNAYLLYRDDQFLCAKAVYEHGGGLVFSTGRLPGVALTGTNTYSWCATLKRLATLGANSSGYAARAPQDVSFTFDSNEARRTARLGQTTYLAAGEVLQYDGARLAESGFHFYPYSFDMLSSGAGSVAVGTYPYKLTMRWANANGESERSTTATIGVASKAVAGAFVMGSAIPYWPTHKTGTAGEIAVEVWRGAVNQPADTPFYLDSSNNPTTLTNPNRYIANSTTLTFFATFRDEKSDATLTTGELNPENGTVLEVLSPPAATLITATDTRMFLGGVAGDPNRVWYSRQRQSNEAAGWNDGLAFDVPQIGGDITAVVFLNDTLCVFRETSIHAFSGDGFDNGGGGQNFGPARIITSDVGAQNAESVVLAPMGLVFKSTKGWYLLDAGWNAKYIGAPVSAFDNETVLALHVVESQHQIRALTSARMLVFDYLANQWGEWTISDGLHSVIWQGSHVYLTATGPKQQLTTYTNLTYGMDIDTAWIKLADLQGSARVRWFEFLGEYRSTFLARIRVARDYQYDSPGVPTYFDDVAWSPSPLIVGSALQLRHALTQQNAQAVKVRFTAVLTGAQAFMSTALDVSGAIQTSGGNLSMVFRALDAFPGAYGNRFTMSFGFDQAAVGQAFVIEVRDQFLFDPSTGRWRELLNNVGVRITLRTGSSPTTNDFINIQNGTTLVQVQSSDPSGNTINAAAMIGQLITGVFHGGTYLTPTGEACKLSGLGIEVGIRQGINRRLPVAQKV